MLGLALVVGSCVPLARGLYHSLSDRTLLELDAVVGGGPVIRPLYVAQGTVLQTALRIVLDAPAGAAEDLSVSYRYVVRAGSVILQREQGLLAIDSPEVTVRATDSSVADSELSMEKRFPVIAAPQSDLTVEVDIAPAAPAQEMAVRAQAILYAANADFALSFFSTLVLLILGLLLALTGAIAWLRSVVGVNVAADTTLGQDDRLWHMFCHLSALLGYLFPFGHVIGPASIWLARRGRDRFADVHGRDCLNFQIAVTLYGVIALILCFVYIGFVLLFVLVLVHVVAVMRAALRAQRGERARYPFSLRVLG